MHREAECSVDADGLRFLGHVLEAYFAWRSNNQRLGYVSFATYMRIPQPIENRRVLNLSDDQFVRVDQAYAQSTHREIVLLEYTSTGSTLQKARRFGFSGANYGAIVGKYRARLKLAEMQLYWLLTPDLQAWMDQRHQEGKIL